MTLNYLKTSAIVFAILSLTALVTSGAYYLFEGRSHVYSVAESSYKSGYEVGYETGFVYGKESVEKTLRHEYQNYIYRMMEEKYDAKDVKHQILTERRIERIMDKSNKKLSDAKKALFKQYIMKWALKYELNPIFVAAMIHRETNFNERAVSKSNARGCLQVIYKYHKDKCDKLKIKEKDLHTINHGVHVGCQVIRQYLEWNDWNYRAALKKYVGAVNNSADGYINDIFAMTMYAYEEREG